VIEDYDPFDLDEAGEDPGPIHTTCRHCGQDIEGYPQADPPDWRDRGNNTECPHPGTGHTHAPIDTVRGH
jgi:hypothetical protein